MTEKVTLTVYGIDIEVEVEHEEGSICDIISVTCNGTPIKCDFDKLYNEANEELHEALESVLQGKKEVWEEQKMDSMRDDSINFGQ